MKIYFIALGIMILSASLQITNDLGVFTSRLPNESYTSAEGLVTQMTNTSKAPDFSVDIFGVGMILKTIGYMTGALKAAIIITPLADQYGISRLVSVPIQGIIWFIYGMGIFQLITGRSTKLYD